MLVTDLHRHLDLIADEGYVADRPDFHARDANGCARLAPAMLRNTVLTEYRSQRSPLPR